MRKYESVDYISTVTQNHSPEHQRLLSAHNSRHACKILLIFMQDMKLDFQKHKTNNFNILIWSWYYSVCFLQVPLLLCTKSRLYPHMPPQITPKHHPDNLQTPLSYSFLLSKTVCPLMCTPFHFQCLSSYYSKRL